MIMITNISHLPQGSLQRMTAAIVGDNVVDQALKVFDKALDGKERREYMNQRNRVIQNIDPEVMKFKEILPNGTYRSSKLRLKTKKPKVYVTILTRQFLIQVPFL